MFNMIKDGQNNLNKTDKVAYKSLNQAARNELKKWVLKAIDSEVNIKTVQRWLNYPEKMPEKYKYIIRPLLTAMVESENISLACEIANVKKQLKQANTQKKAFQNYLKSFSTFDSL